MDTLMFVMRFLTFYFTESIARGSQTGYRGNITLELTKTRGNVILPQGLSLADKRKLCHSTLLNINLQHEIFLQISCFVQCLKSFLAKF